MITRRSRLFAAATAAIALIALPATADASTPPDITLPAFQSSDHAQVIAQRVVTFADGEHHWQLTSHAPTATVSAITTTGPSFLLNTVGPPVLNVAQDGSTTLLDTGQADFVASGQTVDVSAPLGEPAALAQLSIESGDGPDAFTPGPGPRDVELWRDVLAPGQGLSLTAEVSALVLATVGAVDANGTTVPPGVTATFTGELTVVNRTTVPAALVIAIVGPTVPTSSDSASTEPTGSTEPDAPATTAAPPATTAAPPATTAAPVTTAAPTTPPTTIDPTLDSDLDGWVDVEEIDYGTDPNDFDTDGDGLPDGDDLNSFGCDPLLSDTDGDGLNDYEEEIDYVLDCSDDDVDDDGFLDGAEIAAGSDPKDGTDHP